MKYFRMEAGRHVATEVEIAKADPGTHQELTRLAREAKQLWNYPAEWLQAWAEDLRVTSADIETNSAFVAKAERQLAGFYMLQWAEQELWLEHLWVLPRFCGRGIGSKLFAHACAEAKRLGCGHLFIESDPNAEAFYLKMGAKRVSARHAVTHGCERVLPILRVDPSA